MRKLQYSDIHPYLEYIDVHDPFVLCTSYMEHTVMKGCENCPFSDPERFSYCALDMQDNDSQVLLLKKILKLKHPELFI